MDDNGGKWNQEQLPQSQAEPYNPTGPMYQNIGYPPPPVQQSYQNFPNQYFPYPPIYYTPPHLPPPSVPPPSLPPPGPFMHSLPPPQPDKSQFYSAPCNAESELVQPEADDYQWIINWLSQRNIQPLPKKAPLSNSVKLIDIQVLLLSCSSTIKELKKLHQELSTLHSCADETKWSSILTEVSKKKTELASLFSQVRSLDLSAIKAKLSKRSKKRSRLRRKRIKGKELKQAEQARRKMLHQRADTWLAEMRLTVEREHREKELRREADAVLGEVSRKQSEAKRQLSLLDALIKLREVRAQRAAMHSYNQDAEDGNSAKKFVTVIERLRALWVTQLKEYAGEERGLRVMLNESAAQKSDARCRRIKSTIDQWHKAIFGESASNMSFQLNVNELVTVRAEWDKYVVQFYANAPMASSIPVGWVLPQEPSSDLWRPYCVAYDKDD